MSLEGAIFTPVQPGASTPVAAPVAPVETAPVADPAPVVTDPNAVDPPADPVVDPVVDPLAKIIPPTPEPITWDKMSDTDKDTFFSQASGGKLTKHTALNDLLKENEELRNKKVEPQFASDKQKSVYEFLSKLPGKDLVSEVQLYSRIEAANPESLDYLGAIKEMHIIDSLKYGISPIDAAAAFDEELSQKYSAETATSRVLLQKDGAQAKEALLAQKEAIKVQPQAAQPPVQDNKAEVAAQEKAKQDYITQVQKSVKGMEALDFEFGDGPEDKLSFKVNNVAEIERDMTDVNSWWKDRYMNVDASGSFVSHNTDQLKQDMAFLRNRDAILTSIKDHYYNLGLAAEKKQRANIPDNNHIPPAGGGGGAIPKDMNDSLKKAFGI